MELQPAPFQPIFIIGTGRCGSTVFHEILARHPNVAYLSSLCSQFPRRPRLNRWAMHLLDAPLLDGLARRKFPSGEAWPFWEEHCHGFGRPCRDLLASDVRPPVKARLAAILPQMTTGKRSRLLVKISGWPRAGFLSEIFPESVFIHVLRDGRAVANSLLDCDFWLGHRGPQQWRWGSLAANYRYEWEQSGQSFVTLAGLQWKILMDAFERARALLASSSYMEVRYDDLVADPQTVFGDVLSFCRLKRSAAFESAVSGFPFESADFKWKTQLSHQQREELDVVLGSHLAKWGFTPPVARERGDARRARAA
jgi:hypothetical protein